MLLTTESSEGDGQIMQSVTSPLDTVFSGAFSSAMWLLHLQVQEADTDSAG